MTGLLLLKQNQHDKNNKKNGNYIIKKKKQQQREKIRLKRKYKKNIIFPTFVKCPRNKLPVFFKHFLKSKL